MTPTITDEQVAWPTHCIHGLPVDGPWCEKCKRAGSDPEVTEVAWEMLQALHVNIPGNERPMSWSDVNSSQEQRIRGAAIAAIECIRARAVLTAAAQAGKDDRDERQQIVFDWGKRAFGEAQMSDKVVRAARMIEEAAELAQACELPKDHAQRALDHVYGRPAGDPKQEAGGVGVTLMALCQTLGLSADECERVEVARCLSKSVEHFAARNQVKVSAVDMPASAPDTLGRVDDWDNLANMIEHHRGDIGVSMAGGRVWCRYIEPHELPMILAALRSSPSPSYPSHQQHDVTLIQEPSAKSYWIRSGDGSETVRERTPDDPPAKSMARNEPPSPERSAAIETRELERVILDATIRLNRILSPHDQIGQDPC